MVGRRTHEDVGKTTRKRQKRRILDENEQEVLIVPRHKVCQGDTNCESRAHVTLKVSELEITLDI